VSAVVISPEKGTRGAAPPPAPPATPARPAVWSPTGHWRATRRRMRWLLPVNVVLSVWYFTWLLQPSRVGNPFLYGLLVLAEAFNLVQAAGFWWTSVRAGRPPAPPPVWATAGVDVDVLIPVYNEPVDVVEPTLAAAVAMRSSGRIHVVLCDDGGRDEMAALAARHGAGYLRRADHRGAKAGNLNHALDHTRSPLVAVFDCDHVPDPAFLERTVGHFARRNVALVQTPQYYANAGQNPIAAAAWSQQALFFGIIARGKSATGAMFCCGTNAVFRRAALESVGGIPEDSVTEDFALSLEMHERGWRTVYVPEVLAAGLGPEDMASYVSQQHRWARGCLSAIPRAARARLSIGKKLQYLLSSMFFLTGWTYLVYMALPVVRIVGGEQALAGATAAQFLAHFVPYFAVSMATVAIAGEGSYSFAAFALMEASFWIHISASISLLLRRRQGFVVTPKQGRSGRQVRVVLPAVVALLVLAAAAVSGLAASQSPSTLNNVAFAALHMAVLLVGTWPALAGIRPAAGPPVDLRRRPEAA
jgi:cellulose synthase/poly-beta-1,6-N-acetylglucosamine synthase-like glycosyltransferase